MKGHMDITLTLAAVEADRERNAREKMENPNKAFREKTLRMEKRKRVIESKFNRELVAEVTHLEDEDLTEFIALCNFSEDYLFETDLPTIIEDMFAVLDDCQSKRDTIPPDMLSQ